MQASVEASRREVPWWQLITVTLYLLVCTLHALSGIWLLLVPRYFRERLAWVVCCAPWVTYSRWLFAPRVRVDGAVNLPVARHGYLYVANHESALDILLLCATVQRPFLMKRGLLLSPIGWGAYLAGSVAVDRSDACSRASAVRETLAMVTRSTSVIVFPEGTFGHPDGRLRQPHFKLLRAAFAQGLSVVPIGLAGTRRSLDGDRLPFMRGVEQAVVIRKPLQPSSFEGADAFAWACWDSVIDAVRHARIAVGPGEPYARKPDEGVEAPCDPVADVAVTTT